MLSLYLGPNIIYLVFQRYNYLFNPLICACLELGNGKPIQRIRGYLLKNGTVGLLVVEKRSRDQVVQYLPMAADGLVCGCGGLWG